MSPVRVPPYPLRRVPPRLIETRSSSGDSRRLELDRETRHVLRPPATALALFHLRFGDRLEAPALVRVRRGSSRGGARLRHPGRRGGCGQRPQPLLRPELFRPVGRAHVLQHQQRRQGQHGVDQDRRRRAGSGGHPRQLRHRLHVPGHLGPERRAHLRDPREGARRLSARCRPDDATAVRQAQRRA